MKLQKYRNIQKYLGFICHVFDLFVNQDIDLFVNQDIDLSYKNNIILKTVCDDFYYSRDIVHSYSEVSPDEYIGLALYLESLRPDLISNLIYKMKWKLW